MMHRRQPPRLGVPGPERQEDTCSESSSLGDCESLPELQTLSPEKLIDPTPAYKVLGKKRTGMTGDVPEEEEIESRPLNLYTTADSSLDEISEEEETAVVPEKSAIFEEETSLSNSATSSESGETYPERKSTMTFGPFELLERHGYIPYGITKRLADVRSRRAKNSRKSGSTKRTAPESKAESETSLYPEIDFPEKEEEPAMFVTITTFICYAIVILFGYFRDFLRATGLEKNLSAQETERQKDFVPLFSDFEATYARNLFLRLRDCWCRPVAGVPGGEIELVDRISHDHNWTMEYTGKTSTVLNLGSYNYLGFAQNRGPCADAAVEAISKYGLGSCSTRQESGNLKIHAELEQLVADYLGTEAAFCVPMGFATNSMSLPALAGKGSLIISDELNHASLILGCRLSGATKRIFRHNDMRDLERKLRDAIALGQPRTRRPFKKILICVEGVYSMEGTIVKLPTVIELAKKYKAYLYLDEAHSTGAMGSSGRGIVDYWGCDINDVDIMMGTFTKSFGAAGGYIAGSKALVDHLKKASHSSCYSATVAPAVAQQVISSMSIIMGRDGTQEGRRKIEALARNTKYVREKLKQMGFLLYGHRDSPVVPLLLFKPTTLAIVVRMMLEKYGMAVVGVAFPATPMALARIRLCLSASHTKEDLDRTVKAFDEMGTYLRIKHSSKKYRLGEEILY